MVHARFFHRPDLPPLPPSVPVDEIAKLIARRIAENGSFSQFQAQYEIAARFGPEIAKACIYEDALYDRRGKPVRTERTRYKRRAVLHPEILRLLRKQTEGMVIWEAAAKAWQWVGKAALIRNVRSRHRALASPQEGKRRR